MGSGFSKMKKQARMMQQQVDQMRNSMQSTRVEGLAGNGLVKVILNGEKELKNISINPECLSDVEALQDLIIAAYEDATKKVGEESPFPPQF